MAFPARRALDTAAGQGHPDRPLAIGSETEVPGPRWENDFAIHRGEAGPCRVDPLLGAVGMRVEPAREVRARLQRHEQGGCAREVPLKSGLVGAAPHVLAHSTIFRIDDAGLPMNAPKVKTGHSIRMGCERPPSREGITLTQLSEPHAGEGIREAVPSSNLSKGIRALRRISPF